MQAFEQLLEAIEYAQDENDTWSEQFSSKSEARTTLAKAKQQAVDEYDIARLAIIMGEDPPEVLEEVEIIKTRCFTRLKKILNKIR